MTVDQLRKAMTATPFRSFDILTGGRGGGRKFHVPHPDFIAMSPKAERTFVVFGSGGGEDYTALDLLLVVGLDFKTRNGQRRRAG